MDWNLIRIFLTVVDAGSLSKASDMLVMSQPTIGRHISRLESMTGLTLFVRGRSGMELSEAGLNLVEHARAMQLQADQFALKVAGNRQTVAGTVRITASTVVATYLLPPILARLKDAEPDIEIELVASNTVENLLSRDADIAVRMFRPTQGGLIARKVNEMALGIFASRQYLLHYGVPSGMAELAHHRVLGYDRDDRIMVGMKAFGIPAERGMFMLRTDDQVAYWELLKAGAGVGFAAACLARQTVEVVRILPEVDIPPLPMWLTAHQELRTSLRIRRVMDFLSATLQQLDLGHDEPDPILGNPV